jgi:hypothetical protein
MFVSSNAHGRESWESVAGSAREIQWLVVVSVIILSRSSFRLRRVKLLGSRKESEMGG